MLEKLIFEQAIPAYRRTYPEIAVDPTQATAKILDRKNNYADFNKLITFVNTKKAKATVSNQLPTKGTVIAIQEQAGYEEILDGVKDIKQIRNASETTISIGLFQLLRVANIIKLSETSYELTRQTEKFTLLNDVEKAQLLFQAFVKNGKNNLIDECARITIPKIKFSRKNYHLSEARQAVIDLLKAYPVNQWHSFSHFSKELRKKEPHLYHVVGNALVRDDYYNSYYDSPSWRQFEQMAVSIVFSKYLAVLGLLDVTLHETAGTEYNDEFRLEVEHFRITDLGAFVLGLTEIYEPVAATESLSQAEGFSVTANLEIIITPGASRLKHELYFSTFCTKSVENEEMTVFVLDFRSMVLALELGKTIEEIRAYCQANAVEELPEEAAAQFDLWEQQSKAISIRQVTILETHSLALLKALGKIPGVKKHVELENTSYSLILKPSKEGAVKKTLESGGHFVKLIKKS